MKVELPQPKPFEKSTAKVGMLPDTETIELTVIPSTTNSATKFPAVLYSTVCGPGPMAVVGLPPGNDQLYVAPAGTFCELFVKVMVFPAQIETVSFSN